MTRLSTMKPSDATGLTAEIFSSLFESAGMIPTCYVTIATHSPSGLAAILSLDEVVETSTLRPEEIQAIRLVVSIKSGCIYGTAAHSFLGRFAGLPCAVVESINAERDCGIYKLDILLDFVRHLLNSARVVDIDRLDSMRRAGFTEQNIIEIALAITSTMFLNLVNKVNDTTLDYPVQVGP